MYPWAHFVFGSSRLAWCNVCDSSIATWTQSPLVDTLPRATRVKINKHLIECGVER